MFHRKFVEIVFNLIKTIDLDSFEKSSRLHYVEGFGRKDRSLLGLDSYELIGRPMTMRRARREAQQCDTLSMITSTDD